MERINVRVDESLKRSLEDEAREKGVRPPTSSDRRWRSTFTPGPRDSTPARLLSASASSVAPRACPPTSAPIPSTWKASGVTERVLIDAGPLVAIFAKEDEHHRRCVDALGALTVPFFTCWPVITEAAWLHRRRPDTLAKLLQSFNGDFLAPLPLDADDLAEIAAIMRHYESIGLQLADAALVHLADREGIRTVFTVDLRDSSIVRLKRNRALRLIPGAG